MVLDIFLFKCHTYMKVLVLLLVLEVLSKQNGIASAM